MDCGFKSCRKCGAEKPVAAFFRNKTRKDGLQDACKACDQAARRAQREANPEREAAYQAEWRRQNAARKKATDRNHQIRNKDRLKVYHAAYYAKNKEKQRLRNRKWYEINAEKAKSSALVRRQDNPEKVRLCRREHYRKQKARYVAQARQREVAKLQAMPPWADLEKINEMYELAAMATQATGIKHHVDHIHPLRGKNFCGLHVHYNLQVITAAQNLKKSNRLIDECEDVQ